MEKVEIKNGSLYLSDKIVTGVEKLKLKSTADGYAKVYIKLFAKLS